jgi:hypothetical protein
VIWGTEQSVSIQAAAFGSSMSARTVVFAANKGCADLSPEWWSSCSEFVAVELGWFYGDIIGHIDIDTICAAFACVSLNERLGKVQGKPDEVSRPCHKNFQIDRGVPTVTVDL